jgi:hypothetical protein
MRIVGQDRVAAFGVTTRDHPGIAALLGVVRRLDIAQCHPLRRMTACAHGSGCDSLSKSASCPGLEPARVEPRR